MARKYMQNEKDRKDERRGMEKYYKKEKMGGTGMGYKEKMDSGYMGMISEDYSAPANLPQDVKHEYYPKEKYFDGYYLDDSIKGIDENIDDSVRKVEEHQSDSMY